MHETERQFHMTKNKTELGLYVSQVEVQSVCCVLCILTIPSVVCNPKVILRVSSSLHVFLLCESFFFFFFFFIIFKFIFFFFVSFFFFF